VENQETLEALLAKSADSQEEVTNQLGVQVRKAVDVLVQKLDQIRLVKVGFRFDAALLGLCPCRPTLESRFFL